MRFERLGYYAIVLLMILGFASPIYFVGQSEYLERENEALRAQLGQAQTRIAQYERTVRVAVEEMNKVEPTLVQTINARLTQ